MPHRWIAERSDSFDSSGIRKVFDLAANLENPINLSIGQPDFDVHEEVQRAGIEAITSGKSGYTPTQGIPPLLEKLQAEIDQRYGHDDRQVFVTSGTSGGIVLALLAMVNPGEEVIVFDPYFVMYEPLVNMVGGKCVLIDTYPNFRIDVAKVEAAITPRTKLIMANSPANPTGAVASAEDQRQLAELASRHDIALLSDEIYRHFCYDEAFSSPAEFNEQTVVLDGFSKSHAMTGWRLGFAHGPREVIETMTKMQQYTFVCAPQPAQWAGVVALDVDVSESMNDYRRKRDKLIEGLAGHYEVTKPGGAFYAFPKVPGDESASDFVARAIDHGLLIIPGNIFSRRDTHFRISYAADDAVIDRGIEVLRDLAAGS